MEVVLLFVVGCAGHFVLMWLANRKSKQDLDGVEYE
jgi:hypothetical protein